MCIATLVGCGDEGACGESACSNDDAVTAYGTAEGAASSSSILSANGTYGAGCALHANQKWSISLLQGAPLDHSSLEVAKKNSACTLTLDSLRTGAGPSGLYTATSPIVMGASYASGALFTSTVGGLTANAKLSALDFATTFTLTILVSDDVQRSDAGASTHYAYEARVLADAPLSYWRLDDSAPATIASDDFAGTPGVALQSRVGGAVSWTKHSASATDAVVSNDQRIRVGTNKKAVYLAAATPSSADYAVSADVYVASLLPTDQAGVVGRAAAAADTYYFAGLVQLNTIYLVQTRRFELWRYVSGLGILLAAYDDVPVAGTTRRVSLEMVGSTIRASLDGTQRIVVTDNLITAAGSAGIMLGVTTGSAQGEGAGLHLDNVSARYAARARDSVGTNHAFYANGVTRGAAGALTVANAGAYFDGVDDFVEVPRQIGNDFSIELWFKSTQGLGAASVTQWHQTAGLVDAGVSLSNGDFGIGLRSDGKILAGTGKTTCVVLVVCGDDDQTIISGGSTAYNDGVWHHVVFTRAKASGSMTLYVDGVVQGSATGTASTHTLDANANLGIGRLQTGTQYFAGSIDEVAVYSTVLSAQSVMNHFRAGRF